MAEINLMSLGEQEYNELLRQAVAVLPWGHNLLMMNKNLSDEQTIFYAKEVISKGWSLDMLLHAEKDHLDVEVALQDIGKPIGVAEYQYLLPKEELLKIVSSEMDKIDE